MISNSAKDTVALGHKLGNLLKAGDLIALYGDLGSGKTTLTKGIASGLGIRHPEYVNSPSFTIIKEYIGRIRLYHFDLYRLDELSDIEYIRPQEYMDGDGAMVVEWAQKLGELLPEEYLGVSLDIVDRNKRRLTFKPYGRRYETIVDRYIK